MVPIAVVSAALWCWWLEKHAGSQLRPTTHLLSTWTSADESVYIFGQSAQGLESVHSPMSLRTVFVLHHPRRTPGVESLRRAGPRVVTLALGLALFGLMSRASAQTPAPAPTPTPPPAENPMGGVQVGATLEGYYQFNFNRPFDRVTLLRAYDTLANVFSLQQIGLVVERVPDVASNRRFGARVDLQFGQAVEAAQGDPANEPRPDGYRNIWQAYGTYIFPIGRGLEVDFGKFGSNLGYETNYAKDNNQFSRALLFDFLPFYHNGLRLTLPLSDKVTLMYMLTNGVQQTEDFNNYKSNHVTGIVKLTHAVIWTANYYVGREQPDGGLPHGPDGLFRVFDTQLVLAPSTSKFSAALDANYVTNQIYKSDASLALKGLGLYGRYQATARDALSLRYERLDDNGLFSGIAQLLQGVTLTMERKIADGFAIRTECRRDWSNQLLFTAHDVAKSRNHQATLLAGVLWWFGNKSGAW